MGGVSDPVRALGAGKRLEDTRGVRHSTAHEFEEVGTVEPGGPGQGVTLLQNVVGECIAKTL